MPVYIFPVTTHPCLGCDDLNGRRSHTDRWFVENDENTAVFTVNSHESVGILFVDQRLRSGYHSVHNVGNAKIRWNI